MSLSRFQLPYVTTAQRMALVPNDRDILFDTDEGKIYVGDGVTTGGYELGTQGPQGPVGPAGADGRSIVWMGAYNNGTAYVVDDAVSYNGSSYVCILATTGHIPTNTTYWNLIAEKGSDASGDVVGPGSAVNSNLVAFDGTTGTLIKDSGISSSSVVTGVSGTSPIASTGGTTPAISIQKADSTHDGYLSSTDWSTFNGKQPAGSYLTSVTSDSPLSGSGTSGSHLSIPAATAYVNGYLTSTDWSTFNSKQNALTNPVTGTGTNNEIAYFNSTGSTIGSLTTGTYPSLTELSYVKGVTSAIQTQLNGKQASGSYLTSVTSDSPLTGSGTSGSHLSIPAATSSVNGYLTSTDWSTFNGKQAALGFTPENSANKGVVNGYAGLDSSGQVAQNIDASKISSGTINIARLPAGALERLVIVADQTARYALTTAQVQNGDTVKQTDTNVMYFVIDDTQLNNANGYSIYSAGTAASVAWSGVTSTPTTLSGYGITDAVPSSRTVNSKALSSNITLTASDVGAEPTLTKGNLTETTSSVLTITGGTGAVIGSGTTIQVGQATTSTSGYLSSTDWNTFNGKQPAGSYLTSVTSDSPLTGSGTSGSHLSIPAASGTTNGYLTSTDWTTFNNKQPAGSYLTSVTSDAPLTGSGTSGSHLSIPAATNLVSGYLTSTDWSTFNGKYGSGSSPSFATVTTTGNIELGNASDTTIARVSAGVVSVEGKNIALNGTGETLTTGTIELGAASDTTLARVSAGVVSIEGNNIVTNTSSPTLGTITTTGTIELGNASDTTIARVSAGVVSVEGSNIMTVGSADTVTGVKTMSSVVLPDQGSIRLVTPTTNAKATGITTSDYNSGYSSTAVGDLVYLDASATWQKADNTTSATTQQGLLGIALTVASTGNPVTVALPGSFIYTSAGFPTFTVGSPVYMSTAGAVTQTQPSATDAAIRVVGWAVHANKMYFYPSPDYITHS